MICDCLFVFAYNGLLKYYHRTSMDQNVLSGLLSVPQVRAPVLWYLAGSPPFCVCVERKHNSPQPRQERRAGLTLLIQRFLQTPSHDYLDPKERLCCEIRLLKYLVLPPSKLLWDMWRVVFETINL